MPILQKTNFYSDTCAYGIGNYGTHSRHGGGWGHTSFAQDNGVETTLDGLKIKGITLGPLETFLLGLGITDEIPKP